MEFFCFHCYLYTFNQKFGGFINFLRVTQINHTEEQQVSMECFREK